MNKLSAMFGILLGRKSRLQRRKTAVASRSGLVRGLRLEPLEQRQMLSVSIPVPDGNFALDTPSYCINSNSGGNIVVGSTTATLSGWAITANPSTANYGYYASWEPVGAVNNVTSGSGSASFWYTNAPYVGNQPASNYNAFVYSPGELYGGYGGYDVVGGPQPGASLTMATTGITATAVAGDTYGATIEYANVSTSGCNLNPSANVELDILANGAVVGSGTLSGLAQNAAWTPVTATWTATAPYAGQSIQLQVVATNFLEGPTANDLWQVPTFGFTNATLAIASAPTAPSGLTATPSSTSASQINLSWTNTDAFPDGIQIEQATSSDFTQGLTTVTVGADATSYCATGLSASTTYYYRVQAINTVGDSGYTSTASATTQSNTPAAPSGLTATAASSSEIDLSWTNNAFNQTGFQIDQATSSDFTQGLTTVTVGRRDHLQRHWPVRRHHVLLSSTGRQFLRCIRQLVPGERRDRHRWLSGCRSCARWQFCFGYAGLPF